MDKALTPKQRSAIERVRLNPDLQPLFFRAASGLEWFEPLKVAGLIDPSAIPKPISSNRKGYISIPNWPLTDYLVSIAPQLEVPDNERYAREVIGFMRSATAFARAGGYSNHRVWWQFSKVIQHLPLSILAPSDLEMINYWLDDKFDSGLVAEELGERWIVSLLGRHDERARETALGMIDILYRPVLLNSSSDAVGRKASLRFSGWHAQRLTEALAGKSGEVLGERVVRLFRERLESLLMALGNDRWSYLWRPAIEEHEQNQSGEDVEDILVVALRDALLAWSRCTEEAQVVIESMLSSDYFASKRIAIHVVNSAFENLQRFASRILVSENFDEPSLHHELWCLLNARYLQFSAEEKLSAKVIIDAIRVEAETASETEIASAYAKSVWLAAVKDFDEELNQSYERCLATVRTAPEHPDFVSYVSAGWVASESPFLDEDLLSLGVPQLVDRLVGFKEVDVLSGPTLAGLVQALRRVVKASPSRFHACLGEFARAGNRFVAVLLEVYAELWTEKAQLNWDEVWRNLLEFTYTCVTREEFWEELPEAESGLVAARDSVVSAIGHLIEVGTRDDEHSFRPELNELARRNLAIVLNRQSGRGVSLKSDAVSIAINSARGRCIEGLINLTLRDCRLADATGGHAEAWGRFRPLYEDVLRREGEGDAYEMVTLFANHLPVFLYMSRDWTTAHLPVVFERSDHLRWLCALQGYSYVTRLYEDVFRFLKFESHYVRALDDEALDRKVHEKLVQNIGAAYMLGFEELHESCSLVRHLLARGKPSEIGALLWIVWRFRDAKTERMGEIRKRVFDLWRELMPTIDRLAIDSAEVGARLIDWLDFVDIVDDSNRDLIYFSLALGDEHIGAAHLLKNIARMAVRQPAEAAEIWRRVLKNSAPTYPEGELRRALVAIWKSGPRGARDAKDIVGSYMRYGHDSVRTIFNEISGGNIEPLF